MELPKYLVRPTDFHVFELDESNNCYRSHLVTPRYTDGTRPNAMSHFNYENLTENYDFFPITEKEVSHWSQKNDEYCDYINWHTRPDGHGGSKGGSMAEYLEMKQRVADNVAEY